MIIIAITIFLFSAYSFLILYYRQSWLQIPVLRDINILKSKNQKTTVSIVIIARDEENNIRDCLQSIISQTYQGELFEVIVVDDYSTDSTPEIVTSFSNKNVSLILLKDFTGNKKINSYKKKAIEIAISKAKGELIVTTDADCIASPKWLQTIVLFYEKYNPVFIAAPVAFYEENTFLKIFQSLDFMTLQGITGAAVYKKFHNMCNGANLAYQKKVFYEVGGFTGIDAIASGDDMLLMHKIYALYPERVLFLKSQDAIIKTKPMETLNKFFNQRIRWASKADKYGEKKIMAALLLVYIFNAWLIVFCFSSFFYPDNFYWFTAVLLLKFIIELFFLYPVAKFFNKLTLLWWFPFAQPFHIFYIIVAGWLGKFGSYKWKERRVR